MDFEINIRKTHLYVLVVVLALFGAIVLAVGYGSGLSPALAGHSAEEIEVELNGATQTLQSALTDLSSYLDQRTIVVTHSQTTTVPGCESGWNTLWDGYSYIGSSHHTRISTSYQDLGKTGSCLEQFVVHPSLICSLRSGTNYDCAQSYANYFSLWLGVDEFSTPLKVISSLEDVASYRDNSISRCSVCEKDPTPVIVRHDMDGGQPECPGGWSELWRGKSLAYMRSVSWDSYPVDLSSTGSCLKEFKPIPFVECGRGSGALNCNFVSPLDNTGWLTTDKVIDGGAVTSATSGFATLADRTASCVVCSR